MVSKGSPPVARRERRALPRNQRGAPGNPPGRFEVLHIEPESDETCAPDDPASVRGVPTLYFRDTSRSIISSNTQSDDRPRPTSVISHRQVRILSVGIVRASDDSCNNAANERGQILDRKRYGRASFPRFLETRPPLA